MARMIGYIRPCPACGRHGTDTPHGKAHKLYKRAAKRSERANWRNNPDS